MFDAINSLQLRLLYGYLQIYFCLSMLMAQFECILRRQTYPHTVAHSFLFLPSLLLSISPLYGMLKVTNILLPFLPSVYFPILRTVVSTVYTTQ